VVSDSAASRKAVVGIALSLLASTGTSTKDRRRVSNQVPPAGKEELDGRAMSGVSVSEGVWCQWVKGEEGLGRGTSNGGSGGERWGCLSILAA